MKRFPRLSILLPAAAVFLAACSDLPLEPAASPSFSSTSGATLLECPVSETTSTSRTIGPLGGVVELDGHRLVVPVGAVLLPVEIALTVPASNYLKVRFTAGGQEHFQFLEPVSITISYARCTRSNIDKRPLEIWHVSEQSELLSRKGGADVKVTRAVTATSDHFSDYAVGAN
jgi:hypothetical protein